jgi:LmbE family N-acetylglucosaminyl deacetylase
LFYTTIPRSFFLELRRHLDLLGEDTSDFDQMLTEQEGWPDEAVNVTMDVSATVEDKWDALYCHRTQFGPGNFFRRLPEKDAKLLMSKEYFALAWPEPAPGVELPDLFSEI